ncbi:MAG: thiol oxidoreductase [Proteobacteria bacterium]|nr:MAG: thiol oxidoreductase [Pseudomonadota bacterium]
MESAGADAYAHTVAGLSSEQSESVATGHAAFHDVWVVAPDPNGVWGLGPTFNEDRCSACHQNDGRAAAPAGEAEPMRGMLVRLSIPGAGPHGGPKPHPNYGDQLNDKGIPDRVPAEGRAVVSYEAFDVTLADGQKVSMRKPRIRFEDLQFGELAPDVMISPRVAPAVYGLGLLEAVPEKAILAIAERQKAGGMGGRANYVWDYENEQVVFGRFGWKANQPSLRQQIAAAFIGDIGATSFIFQEKNCPGVQTQCRDMPSSTRCGGQGGCNGTFRPEVAPSRLSGLTLYLEALGVPARRNVDDAQVRRGEALFASSKCAVCHVPELQTGGKAALSLTADQVIHPYTDLLLHDMGEALADGRPDYLASGSEWRTPPLWGIGLLKTVNGHTNLLHDGRARDVVEAILWHGGQALPARDAFSNLSKDDREALVKFLESL